MFTLGFKKCTSRLDQVDSFKYKNNGPIYINRKMDEDSTNQTARQGGLGQIFNSVLLI